MESSREGVDREAGLGEQTGRAHERREIKRGKERGREEKKRDIYLTVSCEFVTALLHYILTSTG
jgi:hypothetical protein